MVKYYSMILIAGELLSAACCTPFMWNFSRKRVQLTSGVQYFLYKLVWEVIFMISIIVTFRLLKALFLDSVEMFGVIIAVFYCTILWITVCIIALIVKRRGEFAQMVNTILKLDRLLKRKKIQMIHWLAMCIILLQISLILVNYFRRVPRSFLVRSRKLPEEIDTF